MSRSKVYPGEPRNRSLSLAETNLDITVVTSAEMRLVPLDYRGSWAALGVVGPTLSTRPVQTLMRPLAVDGALGTRLSRRGERPLSRRAGAARSAKAITVPFSPPGRRCPKGG